MLKFLEISSVNTIVPNFFNLLPSIILAQGQKQSQSSPKEQSLGHFLKYSPLQTLEIVLHSPELLFLMLLLEWLIKIYLKHWTDFLVQTLQIL